VRFVTSGLNTLRRPGVVSLDLGLFREFSATERVKIQFRAESFNASNTPHFNNPGTNVGPPAERGRFGFGAPAASLKSRARRTMNGSSASGCESVFKRQP
jgi:hypothetical protein